MPALSTLAPPPLCVSQFDIELPPGLSMQVQQARDLPAPDDSDNSAHATWVRKMKALCDLKPLPAWARAFLATAAPAKPTRKRYTKPDDGSTSWKRQPTKVNNLTRQRHPSLCFNAALNTRMGYNFPVSEDLSSTRVRFQEALHLEVPVTRWAAQYLAPGNRTRVQLPVPWEPDDSGGRRPPLHDRHVDPALLQEPWDPEQFKVMMMALMASTLPPKYFCVGNDVSSYPHLQRWLQTLTGDERTSATHAFLHSSDHIKSQNCFHTNDGLHLPVEVARFDLGDPALSNNAERAAIAARMAWPLMHPIISFWKKAADVVVATVHILSEAAFSYFFDIKFYKTKRKDGQLKNAAEVLVDGIITFMEENANMTSFVGRLRQVLLGYPAVGVNVAGIVAVNDLVDVPEYAGSEQLVMNVECTVCDKHIMEAVNKMTSRNMMQMSTHTYLLLFIGWSRCWNKLQKGYFWEERWVSAHRLLYLFTFGVDLSVDDDVVHVCHNRQCLTVCHLSQTKIPADNTHLRETTLLRQDVGCFIHKRVRDQQLEREEHMRPIKKRFYGLSLPS